MRFTPLATIVASRTSLRAMSTNSGTGGLSKFVDIGPITYSEIASPGFLSSRGKRETNTSLLSLLKTTAISLPTILLFAPLAAISQQILRLKRSKPAERPTIPQSISSLPVVPLTDRDYDVTIMGATGFCGSICLEYYLANYPDVKVAVAGRNEGKLKSTIKKVASALGVEESSIESRVDVLIADSSDYEGLSKVARSSRIVVSTAGPFSRIGTKLVEVCAHSGTSYADITGETAWVRNNIARYGDKAKETGAVIVSLCGHDSIPWELSALKLEQELGKKGEDMKRLVFKDSISSAASGGTVSTIIESVENPEPNERSKGGFDPLYGEKKNGKVRNGSPVFLTKEGSTFLAPFLMSNVNVETIKRSLTLNSDLEYVEGLESDFNTGFSSTLSTWMSMMVLFTPPVRNQLMGRFIPKSGQGPSLKAQKHGYLRVLGEATGSKGSVVKSAIYYDRDPGYRDTARMVCESAMVLLKGEKKEGGVFTPGSVMGEELMERLTKTGTAFAVETNN